MAHSWRSSHRTSRTTPSWQRPHPHRWRRWGKLVLVVGVMGSGYAWLLWGWQIEDVEVVGATLVSNTVVRDVFLGELQGNRWGVVPRRSVAWGGVGGIAARLRERYAFAGVTVERRWSTRPRMQITEQHIVAMAQYAAPTPVLLAAPGTVIGVAPPAFRAAAAETLPRIIFGDRAIPDVGASAIAPAALTFLRALWGDLDAIGGAYEPAHIAPRGASSTEYVLHTTGGIAITVTTSEGMDRQREKLRIVLQGRVAANPKSSTRTIDVRYGDRVYLQ
ncbi:hypothetical protein HY632_03770 [Candidatus Uhrbacteria bacterium]|nr:hypothetical protein [Candidatus Uhrbacteria bacterium]